MMKKLMIAAAMVLMATMPSNFARANEEAFLDEGDSDTAVVNTDEAAQGEDPFAGHEFTEPQDPVKLKSPMPTVSASKASKAAQAQPEPAKLPEGEKVPQVNHEAKAEKKTVKKETKPTGKQAKAVTPTKTPVPDSPAKSAGAAQKSAGKKFAGGAFKTTSDQCPMMRGPASEGQPMLVVKPAHKVWVEDVDGTWVKAFNKKGEPGYLSRDCFK